MAEESTAEAQEQANRASLIAFLSERDVACPLCRYNLRGLLSDRCPECGRELRLSVGLVEPWQGAWLMCQITLAAAGGIGFLVALSVARYGWKPAGNSPVQVICMIYYLFALILAPWVFLLRRPYLRMPQVTQWTLGVLAVATFVASLCAMFASNG